MSKYIFITGGVVSGLGKGITAASLGRLLKMRGLKVIAQKLDPYINVDPGTMSPYQHGEVFVTEDGAETDLDLGHYERFIDEDLNQFSNLTTGKVYWNVLTKERNGDYLGSTVQVIPHITDEIKRFIYSVGEKSGADGILVPGGFGGRGIPGMVLAAKYARENGVPYLGICLGMQIAAIEFARDVLGYADADSTEFSPDTRHPVIDLMPDQQGNLPKGGTMRLGAYPCELAEGSRMRQVYGTASLRERHRHRYEFNNAFREAFAENGMRIAGTSPDGRLVEAVELPDHPFFLAVQFHPEFKSRPNKAHPLFAGFIRAALDLSLIHI